MVSKSARASSISTTFRCSTGSTGPGTSGSGNALRTKTIASTSRMPAKKRLPRPSPFAAPSTNPPISVNWIVVGTIFLESLMSPKRKSLLSGTIATPIFGSVVANA